MLQMPKTWTSAWENPRHKYIQPKRDAMWTANGKAAVIELGKPVRVHTRVVHARCWPRRKRIQYLQCWVLVLIWCDPSFWFPCSSLVYNVLSYLRNVSCVFNLQKLTPPAFSLSRDFELGLLNTLRTVHIVGTLGDE